MHRFWRFFLRKVPTIFKFFSEIFLARALTSKTPFGGHFDARGFQNRPKMKVWRLKSKYNHDNHWPTFPDSVNRVKIRNTFFLVKIFGARTPRKFFIPFWNFFPQKLFLVFFWCKIFSTFFFFEIFLKIFSRIFYV